MPDVPEMTLAEATAALAGRGRYDLIIFANGGYECLAKIASMPPAPESVYKQAINAFVPEHKPRRGAVRYTVIYDSDGQCQFEDWQGPIIYPEPETDNI